MASPIYWRFFWWNKHEILKIVNLLIMFTWKTELLKPFKPFQNFISQSLASFFSADDFTSIIYVGEYNNDGKD